MTILVITQKRYRTGDGQEFDTPAQARAHERFLAVEAELKKAGFDENQIAWLSNNLDRLARITSGPMKKGV